MKTSHQLGALPPELEEAALIDGATCARTGGMSISWWNTEVTAGRAPQPVIRAPRCTRWRLNEVKAYWLARAAAGSSTEVASQVVAKARKASIAAKLAAIRGRRQVDKEA